MPMYAKALVLVAALFLVVFGGYFIYSKTTYQEIGQPGTSAFSLTYRNDEYRYQVVYPGNVFRVVPREVIVQPGSTEKTAGTLFVHSVPVEHCALSGLPEHCTPHTEDITLGFFVINEDLEGLLGELQSFYGSLVEEFALGELKGYRIIMGAEGEGIHQYFFPLRENQTLTVVRSYVDERAFPRYQNVKDFILFEEQEKITERVLQSLIIDKESGSPQLGGNLMSLAVYFFNSQIEPVEECKEVIGVERKVPKNGVVARAALEELLRGPSEEERLEGYTSEIPHGSVINSIEIANGEARVDFNKTIQEGGGSCHMVGLTEQLSKTLLQFPEIQSVKFSVEGQTESIFQP